MAPRPPLSPRSIARILLRYVAAIVFFVATAVGGVVLYATHDGPTAQIGGLAIALTGTLVFFAATVHVARDLGVERFDHTDPFVRLRAAPHGIGVYAADRRDQKTACDPGSEDSDPPEAA